MQILQQSIKGFCFLWTTTVLHKSIPHWDLANHWKMTPKENSAMKLSCVVDANILSNNSFVETHINKI